MSKRMTAYVLIALSIGFGGETGAPAVGSAEPNQAISSLRPSLFQRRADSITIARRTVNGYRGTSRQAVSYQKA